jgi:hypothetical protein
MMAFYPRLLQVDEDLFKMRITQIFSSAYIELYLSNHGIDGYAVHPMDQVGVFHFSEGDDYSSHDLASTCWMMILLPARGDTMSYGEWLEATDFSINSQAKYDSWLAERAEGDDFTVVFVSSKPDREQGDLKNYVKLKKPHSKSLV